MKKLIFVLFAIMVLSSQLVFAGDVPEALSYEDDAQVFIGTLKDFKTSDSSDTMAHDVQVIPTLKIKGDVSINETEIFDLCYFGKVIPQKEKEYLFGWLSDNSVWAYEVEHYNENEIKLEITDEFAERIQDYLDEGLYLMSEQERLTLGDKISFLEYLYKNPSFSSSGVEKVILRYQDEVHEVNKDEFFEVAENIMITNVKNDILLDAKANPHSADAYKSILYIELQDINGQLVYYGAVSRFGEVDRNSLSMSRLMTKDYEMKTEDLLKLYSFLPDNVQKKIVLSEDVPPANNDRCIQENDALAFSGMHTFTIWIIFGVIVVFVVSFIISYRIRKKRKK